MIVTNNTKNKQEIHGIKSTVPIMPGKSVTIKEKDIAAHEIERISKIMKVEQPAPVQQAPAIKESK